MTTNVKESMFYRSKLSFNVRKKKKVQSSNIYFNGTCPTLYIYAMDLNSDCITKCEGTTNYEKVVYATNSIYLLCTVYIEQSHVTEAYIFFLNS